MHQVDFLNIASSEARGQVNFFSDIEGDMEPILRQTENNDWFFLVAVGILALIAIARNYAPRRFQMIAGASYSIRRLTWLRDDGNVFFNPTSAALFLVSIIVAALYAYGFHDYFNEIQPFENDDDLFLVARLSAAIALFWVLKDTLILTIGKLFKSPVSSFLNLVNQYVINVIAALILFGFVVFHFYLNQNILLIAPLYFVIIIYIYRLIRTFIIGRKTEGFFPFYIILYLCALEILPVLFLYKVIEKYI